MKVIALVVGAVIFVGLVGCAASIIAVLKAQKAQKQNYY